MTPGVAQATVLSHRHLFTRHHGGSLAHAAGLGADHWVLPGITVTELRQRRQRLFDALPPGSIALVFAKDVAIRSHDIPHHTRASSLFAYLTGCLTPLHEWRSSSRWLSLLMMSKSFQSQPRTVLFVPPRHAAEEAWGGKRFSSSEASDLFFGLHAQDEECAAADDGPLEMIVAEVRRLGESAAHSSRSLKGSMAFRHALLPSLYMDVPTGLAFHQIADVELPREMCGVSNSSSALRYTHPLLPVVDALRHVEHQCDFVDATDSSTVVIRHVSQYTGADNLLGIQVSPSGQPTPAGLFPVSAVRFASAVPVHRDSTLPRTTPRFLRGTKPIAPLTLAVGIAQAVRLYKSNADIAMFMTSGIITAHGFVAAMAASRTSRTEEDIHRCIQHECWQLGAAETLAYPPVVASGLNATCVDYTQNLSELPSDGLVMVDAGAEYGSIYPTDCTRCWPCRGRPFSPGQRRLYESVLRVQRAIMREVAVGVSRVYLQRKTVELLTLELIMLGVLQPGGPAAAMRRLTRAIFPHDFGHYCGIDIHERGPAEIPARCMLTVEPGLYIPASIDDLSARCSGNAADIQEDLSTALLALPDDLRGVGVRVEDSLFVLPLPSAERALCLKQALAALCTFDNGSLASPSSRSALLRRTLGEKGLRATGDDHLSLRDVFLTVQAASLSDDMPLAKRMQAADEDELGSWYPHSIVVTTALAPKSIDALEAICCPQQTVVV